MYSKTLHFFSKSKFSWKYTYYMLFLRKKSDSQNVNKKGGGKKKHLCLLEKFSLLKTEYLFSALSSAFKICSNSSA